MIAILLACLLLNLLGPWANASPKTDGPEASQYATEVIAPILVSAANDSNETPGLRSRLLTFVGMFKARNLLYIVRPNYDSEQKQILAKIEIVEGHVPRLIVFIPAVQDWEAVLQPEEFRSGVLTMFAHEMMHLELADRYPENTDESVSKEEAAVWGRTILEVIRPLMKAGREVPLSQRLLSERFAQLKNDHTNPAWISLFAPKH